MKKEIKFCLVFMLSIFKNQTYIILENSQLTLL